jgi:sulfur-carrier protein
VERHSECHVRFLGCSQSAHQRRHAVSRAPNTFVLECVDQRPGRALHLERGAYSIQPGHHVRASWTVQRTGPGGCAERAAPSARRWLHARLTFLADDVAEAPARDAPRRVQNVECLRGREAEHGRQSTTTDGVAYNWTVAVTILLFASIAQKAGIRRLELPACDGDTVAGVRDRVIAKFPELRDFVPTLLYALDEEYVKEDARVMDGATVALIPPVSGG